MWARTSVCRRCPYIFSMHLSSSTMKLVFSDCKTTSRISTAWNQCLQSQTFLVLNTAIDSRGTQVNKLDSRHPSKQHSLQAELNVLWGKVGEKHILTLTKKKKKLCFLIKMQKWKQSRRGSHNKNIFCSYSLYQSASVNLIRTSWANRDGW